MKILAKSINCFLALLLFSISVFGQSSVKKLKITNLTNDFYIFTTFRPYKGNLVSSNGMYLVTNEGVVIIDSPWDTTQFQPLLDSIKLKHNKKVVMCIATHSHEDRTGALEYFRLQGIKTFTSKQTDKICAERKEHRAEFTFEKDTLFNIGGYAFQTFYGGPGHAPDNIVLWFEKDKILYGGCLVKSTEARDLGNMNDANVKEWPNTIKNIQNKFGKAKYIIPGHQSWKSNESLKHTLMLLKNKS